MRDESESDDGSEEDWTDEETCEPIPIKNQRVKSDRPLVPQGRVYWPLKKD